MALVLGVRYATILVTAQTTVGIRYLSGNECQSLVEDIYHGKGMESDLHSMVQKHSAETRTSSSSFSSTSVSDENPVAFEGRSRSSFWRHFFLVDLEAQHFSAVRTIMRSPDGMQTEMLSSFPEVILYLWRYWIQETVATIWRKLDATQSEKEIADEKQTNSLEKDTEQAADYVSATDSSFTDTAYRIEFSRNSQQLKWKRASRRWNRPEKERRFGYSPTNKTTEWHASFRDTTLLGNSTGNSTVECNSTDNSYTTNTEGGVTPEKDVRQYLRDSRLTNRRPNNYFWPDFGRTIHGFDVAVDPEDSVVGGSLRNFGTYEDPISFYFRLLTELATAVSVTAMDGFIKEEFKEDMGHSFIQNPVISFVDIGGNVGYHTYSVADKMKELQYRYQKEFAVSNLDFRIFNFEPNPEAVYLQCVTGLVNGFFDNNSFSSRKSDVLHHVKNDPSVNVDSKMIKNDPSIHFLPYGLKGAPNGLEATAQERDSTSTGEQLYLNVEAPENLGGASVMTAEQASDLTKPAKFRERSRKFPVETITLDGAMGNLNSSSEIEDLHFTFLKIDINGGECNILKEATEFLSNNVVLGVFIELTQPQISSKWHYIRNESHSTVFEAADRHDNGCWANLVAQISSQERNDPSKHSFKESTSYSKESNYYTPREKDFLSVMDEWNLTTILPYKVTQYFMEPIGILEASNTREGLKRLSSILPLRNQHMATELIGNLLFLPRRIEWGRIRALLRELMERKLKKQKDKKKQSKSSMKSSIVVPSLGSNYSIMNHRKNKRDILLGQFLHAALTMYVGRHCGHCEYMPLRYTETLMRPLSTQLHIPAYQYYLEKRLEDPTLFEGLHSDLMARLDPTGIGSYRGIGLETLDGKENATELTERYNSVHLQTYTDRWKALNIETYFRMQVLKNWASDTDRLQLMALAARRLKLVAQRMKISFVKDIIFKIKSSDDLLEVLSMAGTGFVYSPPLKNLIGKNSASQIILARSSSSHLTTRMSTRTIADNDDFKAELTDEEQYWWWEKCHQMEVGDGKMPAFVQVLQPNMAPFKIEEFRDLFQHSGNKIVRSPVISRTHPNSGISSQLADDENPFSDTEKLELDEEKTTVPPASPMSYDFAFNPFEVALTPTIFLHQMNLVKINLEKPNGKNTFKSAMKKHYFDEQGNSRFNMAHFRHRVETWQKDQQKNTKNPLEIDHDYIDFRVYSERQILGITNGVYSYVYPLKHAVGNIMKDKIGAVLDSYPQLAVR